jgi:hypothetical protein
MSFGGDENQVKIKIVVEDGQAYAVLNKTEDKLRGLGGAASKAGLALKAAFSGAAVYAAVRNLDNILKRADRFEDAAKGFNAFSKAIGNAPSAKLDNLKRGVDGLVTSVDLMTASSRLMSAGIDKGNGKIDQMIGMAAKLGEATGMGAKGGIDAMTQALITGQTRGIAPMVGHMGRLTDKSERIEKIFEALSGRTKILGNDTATAAGEWEKLGNNLNDLKDTFAALVSQSDMLTEAIRGMNKALTEINSVKFGVGLESFINSIKTAITSGAGLSNLFSPAILQSGLMQTLLNRGSTALVGGGLQLFGLTGGGGASGAAGEITDEVKKNTKAVTEAAKETNDLIAAMERMPEDFASLSAEQQREMIASALGAPASAGAGGGLMSGVMLAIGQSLAASFSGIFSGGYSTSNLLGGVGEAVGGAVGESLSEDLAGEFGTILGADIGSAILGPIAGALGGELLGSIGNFIGDAIDSLFGSATTNPETLARDSGNAWFDEQLQARRVQMMFGGTARNVDSLAFESQYNANMLPGFFGPGQALTSMFGGEIPKGQLARILSSNMSGFGAGDENALNNLQMLLQAIGVSAEQMGKALEDGFMAGEMSAREFLAFSNEVNDVYQQGIPGAVGATNQAFQNLVDGGLQNGRVAWDSLGDIAAEAMEKGITSLEQLRDDLIAGGADVAEVDKLFQSLSQNGITSLEQLADLNSTQVAQLIVNLEDLGFAFQEPVEQVQNLEAALKEIDKHSDLQTNFSLNMSAEDREIALWAAAGGGSAGGTSASGSGGGTTTEDPFGSNDFTLGGGPVVAGLTAMGLSTDFASSHPKLARKGYDTMVERIIKGFKRGKFDLGTANAMIAGLPADAVRVPGIGGVGNTGGALSRAILGGSTPQGVRGLRNLFQEADEAGLGMGGLQRSLLDSGYSQGAVQNLMDLFGEHGINSVDVGLNMDNAGLMDLLDDLNSLPDHRTLYVDVVTRYPNGELPYADRTGYQETPGMGGERRNRNRRRRNRRRNQ